MDEHRILMIHPHKHAAQKHKMVANLARKEKMVAEKTEKRTYTVKEVGTILGISRPTVYSLLKKKEFSWVRIDGGKYRISKRSFDDWLDKGPVR